MGKKRTLADELADLATTAPSKSDFDADRYELGDDARLAESDDELEQVHKRSRKAPEKGLRLRRAIELTDSGYEGRSRPQAEIFADRFGQESDGTSQSTANGDSSSEEEPSALVEDAPNIHSRGDLSSGEEAQLSEGGALDDASAEDDSDGENTRQKGSDMEASGELGVTIIRQKSSRLARDQAKAEAVRNQRTVYERFLEYRIMLQQMMTASHRLPPPPIFLDLQRASESVKESSQDALQEIQSALETLLDLQQGLLSRNPDVDASSSEPEEGTLGSGVGVSILWHKLDRSYRQIQKFRDASLDQWHRKVLLGSGQAALKGSLHLLDQSISAQVASLLQDSKRLLKKSQLSLEEAPLQLCVVPAAVLETDADRSLDARDPERFDDKTFYQQLLKEFLEVNSAGILATGAAASMKRKKKPNVRDRRASKGRRLRYNVQEKLVNFMVPKRYEELPVASQLFKNLFGHGAS